VPMNQLPITALQPKYARDANGNSSQFFAAANLGSSAFNFDNARKISRDIFCDEFNTCNLSLPVV